MSDNLEEPVTGVAISRRNVLTFAGMALGTVAIQAVLPASASAATGGDATTTGAAAADPLTLEPVTSDTVQVMSANPSALVTYPRQLAFRVRNGGPALPAGAQLDVTFDQRLYAPLPSPVLTMGGTAVTRFTAADPVTDPTTGVTSRMLTVNVPIPTTSRVDDALVIVLGTAHPLLYPRDLLRSPFPTGAQVPAPSRAHKVRAHRTFSGGERRFAAGQLPWGIELAGWWGHRTWGDNQEFRYYYPTQVTIRSVGPGPVPVAPTFTVDLDPRLVRDLTPTYLRLNDRTHAGRVRRVSVLRTAEVFRTEWAAPSALNRDDVLDLGFDVALADPPTGPLSTIKHPVVTLGAMGLDPHQRETGRTSLARLDSTWERVVQKATG